MSIIDDVRIKQDWGSDGYKFDPQAKDDTPQTDERGHSITVPINVSVANASELAKAYGGGHPGYPRQYSQKSPKLHQRKSAQQLAGKTYHDGYQPRTQKNFSDIVRAAQQRKARPVAVLKGVKEFRHKEGALCTYSYAFEVETAHGYHYTAVGPSSSIPAEVEIGGVVHQLDTREYWAGVPHLTTSPTGRVPDPPQVNPCDEIYLPEDLVRSRKRLADHALAFDTDFTEIEKRVIAYDQE